VRRTELRERLDPEHGGVGSSAVAAAAAARQEALTVKQAQLSAVLRAVDDNRDRLNQIESELLERRQVHYYIVILLLLLLLLLLDVVVGAVVDAAIAVRALLFKVMLLVTGSRCHNNCEYCSYACNTSLLLSL
jgi:hypothetical protein